MSLPRSTINSITYTSSVLSLNVNYSQLRGGGSFSLVGLPSTIYFSATTSYQQNLVSTYSISLSASRTFNLTYSFYKGPHIDYPLNQPVILGMTYGIPYITGYSNAPANIIYEVDYVLGNYVLNT
jgi:hypothetical protein